MPDLQMLNGRGGHIHPRGGCSDTFHINDLTRLGIDIQETDRDPRRIEGKDPDFGQVSIPTVVHLEEYDAPQRAGFALEVRIIHL